MMRFLAVSLSVLTSVSGTILSDSGCSCVVTKTALTAPGAATSIAAGCSVKPDWLLSTSKWCLTDQVASPGCGTLQAGFGWADSCAVAGFPTFSVSGPPSLLSSDQTPTIFYTGQILTVNWTTQNIAVDEWLRLTYMGVSLRTLTTGSGVNITAGNFSVRISDSANSLTPTGGSPLTLSTTNPLLSVNSAQNITVLQSKIVAANVFDGNRTVGTGSIVTDNRNVTIQWISAGEATIGVATVTIRSNGGGGGGGTTVGTPITGIIVGPGNMTVNYTLPRTFVPGGGGGGGTTYSAQISVQSPGVGVAPYTLSSTGFTLVAALTPSPSPTSSNSASKTSSGTPSTTPTMSLGASFSGTSSITPTVSLTTTASLSFGATPSTSSTISVSPSVTPTLSQTPSVTPTASSSTSLTQTPAPSVDYVGIAKAAAAESDAKTGVIVGGAIGGLIALVALSFVAFKINQRYEAHLRRARRLRAPARNYEEESRNIYGVQQQTIGEGGTVMYQVTMPQPQQQRPSPGRGYQSSSSRRLGSRRS
jgi:hypothetical protein